LDYGHYYSVAKEDVSTKDWILFDDSRIVPIGNIDPFEYVKYYITTGELF
jgi:ubiquitin C-terminal hydrolase